MTRDSKEKHSKYGDTVRGQLYDVVHQICVVEAGVSLSADRRDKFVLEWRSPPGYRIPLILTGLGRSWSNLKGLSVHAFSLELQEMGERISLSDDFYAPKGDLDDDHSRFILASARQALAVHEHADCLTAVEQEKAAAEARRKILYPQFA